MCTKTFRRIIVAALSALVYSVSSSAQSYTNWGDLERARAQQIQQQRERDAAREYNERLMRLNFGKGGPVVDYEKFETAKCPVFFRGGMTMGLSECATLGYNASVSLQMGGFRGFIFCPEIGIGTRNIDDTWGDVLEYMTTDLRTTNITVRPLQVGYSIYGGDQAVSFCGGLYASCDLSRTATYKPSSPSYSYFEGSEPCYRPFDIGACFSVDMVVFKRVDFNMVFDFGTLSMFKHDQRYHWCDILFRLGFWI